MYIYQLYVLRELWRVLSVVLLLYLDLCSGIMAVGVNDVLVGFGFFLKQLFFFK